MNIYDELAHALDNLTATQERCNQLLDEARDARKQAEAYREVAMILADELTYTRSLLNDLVEALGDAIPPATAPEGPAN